MSLTRVLYKNKEAVQSSNLVMVNIVHTSLKKVIIPADINGTKVKIETDVIDNSLPLLLRNLLCKKQLQRLTV